MATITRTHEMFTYRPQTLARTPFWDTLCRVVNRLFLPEWVVEYAVQKAAEIERQQMHHS